MAQSFAFIGTGSMSGAILDGLLASGSAATIKATTSPSTKQRDGVEARSLATDSAANRWAASGSDVVIIGVKPAMVLGVIAEIADVLEPGALIISVAAGVTTASIEKLVSVAVVRAMPNTPSLIGKGVTGLASGSKASAANLAEARRLFEKVGFVVELPESQIDALSTISGSGPAYVFHAIEKWTQAAIALGFNEKTASQLVEKTFAGATALLEASGEAPAELRRRVTSPKGTTERAIAVLDEAGLEQVYLSAAKAALARAQEMAGEN